MPEKKQVGSCPRWHTCRKWSGTLPLSTPAVCIDQRGSVKNSCSQSTQQLQGPPWPRRYSQGRTPPSLTVQHTHSTLLMRLLKGTCIHRGFTLLKNRCALSSGEHGDPREGQEALLLRLWVQWTEKPSGSSQQPGDGWPPRVPCRNKAAGNAGVPWHPGPPRVTWA